MIKPLYVSFFTEKYRASAAELVATLDAFELEHEVRFLDADPDWVANVQRKPAYILQALLQHPGRPIVWLDADARVRKRPELFDAWACDLTRKRVAPDFAAHWLGGIELLSGTMWFGPTPAAVKLASQWRTYQESRRDLVDQVALEHVMPPGAPRNLPEGLKIAVLPAPYTAIFDHGMCEPHQWVISHHQHSRQHRFVTSP